MATHVRLATGTDEELDAINGIYNPYVLASTCTAEVEPVTLEQRRAWFEGRDRTRYPVTVAEDDGDIVAWGALSPYHPRWGYRFTVENSVYVRQDRHRHGLGGRILEDLIARATATELRSIVALITDDQTASVVLHARAGFVKVGHLSNVIHKHERWIGLLLMQRELP